MQTKEFCAYNETRENYLSSRVTVIDSKADPLKGIKALIEGLGPNQEAGLWLNPLKSAPTVPTMSPYDLVYLDQDCRVVNSVAMIPDDEVPHFGGQATSALLLPIHTFSKSQAHPGDQVIICAAEEIAHRAACVPAVRVPLAAIPVPTPQISDFLAEPHGSNPAIHPPLLTATSSPSQTAISPLDAIDQIQSPLRKKESPGARFLRGIVHLRIHISFSIAPVTASKTANQSQQSTGNLPARSTGKSPILTATQWTRNFYTRSTEKWTARSASLKSRLFSWSQQFEQKRVRPSIAAIVEFTAKAAQFFARKYESSKTSYLQWADNFIRGNARIAAGAASAKTKHSAIRASRRQFLRARFPR